MWEVTEECKTLLQSWCDRLEDGNVKEIAGKWLKKELLVLDFDELMEVLRPLANEVPVYKFIERLKIYKPVVKKVVDPVYQARIQKLKWEQENREYAEMTRSIDPNQHYGKSKLMGTFGEEMRSVNRQMIAVFNTILTVGGAFSFGFFGISYAYPHVNMSIATRMTIGFVLATVVFFADLYFIVKSMDDSHITCSPKQTLTEKLVPSNHLPKEPNINEAKASPKNEVNVPLKSRAKMKTKKTKHRD